MERGSPCVIRVNPWLNLFFSVSSVTLWLDLNFTTDF
jgi:hypothetical protein